MAKNCRPFEKNHSHSFPKQLLSQTVLGWLFSLTLILTFPSLEAQENLIGLNAPAFSLSGTDGNTYTLDDLLKSGPAILCWFPKAYTGNSEKMLLSVNSIHEELTSRQIRVVALSCDKLKYLKPFATELSLRYPVLADPTRNAAIQWTVVHNQREIPHRWIFFIGTDRKIKAVLSEFEAGNSAEVIRNQLQKLGWLP